METTLFNETNIPKVYFHFSLPVVLSMVVTMIYNLADTYFVAQTGSTELIAGVSLCAPVFTILMAFGNIFGQGGASLISRLMGNQNTEGVRHVSAFCFYGSILTGAAAAIMLLIFDTPVLSMFGATQETAAYAGSYFTFIVIGAPLIVLSFIPSNILRSEGLSRESMGGTICGLLVNIVLDPILISVLGMGASGAAIASVLGYLTSDLYFIWKIRTRSRLFSMKPSEIRISPGFFRQILGIGIPAAIVNIMQSISVILINRFLLPYGSNSIAAMGIVQKISLIILLALTGFSFGSQPLFGYYYGAKDFERFRKLYRFTLKFISLLALTLTAVIFIPAAAWIRIFINDTEMIRIGTPMLRMQVISMVFVGYILLVSILFQSTGKSIGSLILSVSRQGVIFFFALLFATTLFGYTGILIAQAVADVITAGIAFVLFLKLLSPEIQADC